MSGNLILGCIADDFTGASDAASFLVEGGLRTLLFNGIPTEADAEKGQQVDAIVIALKTRTQAAGPAVAESLAALRWLKEQGARQLYIKYCSTFDSTKEGNIGPIVDAAIKLCQADYTVLCPSLPVNGRTVRDGCLFVNGVPLAESPMKDHPLTPMRESDITRLMQAQSRHCCVKLSKEEMAAGKAAVDKRIAEWSQTAKVFYIVPDFSEDSDAERIVEQFGRLPLLTGGSGLMTALARYHRREKTVTEQMPTGTTGQGLVLAGSCSRATLAQIAHFQKQGGVSCKLDPRALQEGRQTLAEVWDFIAVNLEQTVLVYSSESAQYLEAIRESELEGFSRILENTMAVLAKQAVSNGIRRIVVAGGETSGAVTKALGFSAYWIGESVAPGVPVMIPCSREDVRLVLKSGNFGQEDFFARALAMTKK